MINFLADVDEIRQELVTKKPAKNINNKFSSLVEGVLKMKRIVLVIKPPVKKIGIIF